MKTLKNPQEMARRSVNSRGEAPRVTVSPGDRLPKLHEWLAAELYRVLDWPRHPILHEAQITICGRWMGGFLEEIAAEPWLFDPAPLAAHLRARLASVGRLHKAGDMRPDELATSLAQISRGWRAARFASLQGAYVRPASSLVRD